VFRINRDAQGGSGMTQFGRARAELNIEIICTNSSQGKAQSQSHVAGSPGFDPSAATRNGGIGIRSIEERVKLVGGQIEIHSMPAEGTKIDVRVPM